MRRVDIRERELRGTEGVFVVHELALRDVHQAPTDRREGRRIVMRQLRVVGGPFPTLVLSYGPAPSDRLPEELIVGEPFDPRADERIRAIELGTEQIDRPSPHDRTIPRC